jgi:EAL domain-containing protein (putative c-di-GMP-specific phosphodiesterase class I)/PAS domain-containing protein
LIYPQMVPTDVGEYEMQGPLRVVFIEHGQESHGIAAQLLSEHHLDFSRQRAGSPQELSEIAKNFQPHIVLCTDDISTDSNHGILEALRLLCSQTPAILVSGVYDMHPAVMRQTAPRRPVTAVRIAQDAADLRRGFAAVLESSAAPAVMSNAQGWITHANTRACSLLAASSARSLLTLLSATQDQCPPMPHWLPASHDIDPCPETGAAASGGTASPPCHRRLAYLDSWSLLPRLVHVEDLVGCLTAPDRDHREALAVIALDRDSGRIPDAPGEFTRYGSIVCISPDDFLTVLPDPARPSDAVITVRTLLESIVQAHSSVGPGRQAPGISVDSTARACDSGVLRRCTQSTRASTGAQRMHRLLRYTAPGGAMQCQSLSVQYQPQFDVKTGRGCGVEALARWKLSSGENIAPSVFIPAAERMGLIHGLGAWMLQSACETAYPWCSRDAQRTTLSVNVSPRQIDGQFSEVIGRTLERIGFPAKQLELEITESALIENPDATIEYLKQWKELGVRIAMDDFGAGTSSLSHLCRLPVDRLKLDQSLVHGMTADKKTAAVMRSIVSMGAELGMDVIAEGVETEQQLQMLTDLECPRVQGYLFGRPMPAQQAHLALRKAWGNRPLPRSHAMEASHA